MPEQSARVASLPPQCGMWGRSALWTLPAVAALTVNGLFSWSAPGAFVIGHHRRFRERRHLMQWVAVLDWYSCR